MWLLLIVKEEVMCIYLVTSLEHGAFRFFNVL